MDFFESENARCRFGVEGYYAETSAKFIDSNTIVCPSPENYLIPNAGQLPFTVPFSIALNEDQFNPFTESSHVYSFYGASEIQDIQPKETKTRVIREVLVIASEDKPFSFPSAAIIEEDVVDFSGKGNANGKIINRKSFAYEPIACKFGRFGITVGQYVNRTMIRCITPSIDDDSDIAREEVELAIALNGYDFISNSDIPFTFIGPSSGTMIWYYLLLIFFLIALILALSTCISSYLNKMRSQSGFSDDRPHTVNRRPRYYNQEDDKQRELIENQSDYAKAGHELGKKNSSRKGIAPPNVDKNKIPFLDLPPGK